MRLLIGDFEESNIDRRVPPTKSTVFLQRRDSGFTSNR